MGKFWKSLRAFMRPTVFNRVAVLLTLAVVLVIPSTVLYQITDFNNNMSVVLPCLILIAASLGSGLFSIYRPSRTSWFFFLEILLILGVYGTSFSIPGNVILPYDITIIYLVDILLSVFGLVVNFFYLLSYLKMKRRLKTELNEETNNDTLFEFLSGKEEKTNEDVEKDLAKITADSPNYSKAMKFAKQYKFSKFTRIASFAIVFFVSISQLTKLGMDSQPFNVASFYPLLYLVLLLPILFVASLLYPRDFKYPFYYHSFLFSLCGMLGSREAGLSSVGFILEMVILGVSFLVTMIVEGRTWTGSKPDGK